MFLLFNSVGGDEELAKKVREGAGGGIFRLSASSLSSGSSSSTGGVRCRRFFLLELRMLKSELGGDEVTSGSVSRLGKVSIGGWSYGLLVDEGGSEGVSCKGNSLNGIGRSASGGEDDKGNGVVRWQVGTRSDDMGWVVLMESFDLRMGRGRGLGLGLGAE